MCIRDSLLTFLKVQQLKETISQAVRGTLALKKVGIYTYFDHQIWENGKRTREHVKTKQLDALREKIDLRQDQERQLKGLKSYLEELRKSLRHFKVKLETILEAYESQQQERTKQEEEKQVNRIV